MNVKIAICDDEKIYINQIEQIFDKVTDSEIDYDVFMNGEEIVSRYERYEADYDAIFLDMDMGELDGIRTANRIREIDKYVIIVFVTSHTKYMKECFQCEPFRFLVKPIDTDEINKAIKDIFAKLSQERKTFIFSENRNKVRLFCDSIIYFESKAHYLYIHTNDTEYKTTQPINKLEKVIDKDVFSKVHKSFIINLGYVKKIKGSEIYLYGTDTIIPIGRKYQKDFMDSFIKYKERKYLL